MCVSTETATKKGEEEVIVREKVVAESQKSSMAVVTENEKEEGHTWTEESITFVARLWELSDQETKDLTEIGVRLCRKVPPSSSTNKGDADDNDDDYEFVANHFKTTPLQVVRFLRARPGNVDAAESMFRIMIAWRRANKVDTILRDYTPPDTLVQKLSRCHFARNGQGWRSHFFGSHGCDGRLWPRPTIWTRGVG